MANPEYLPITWEGINDTLLQSFAYLAGGHLLELVPDGAKSLMVHCWCETFRVISPDAAGQRLKASITKYLQQNSHPSEYNRGRAACLVPPAPGACMPHLFKDTQRTIQDAQAWPHDGQASAAVARCVHMHTPFAAHMCIFRSWRHALPACTHPAIFCCCTGAPGIRRITTGFKLTDLGLPAIKAACDAILVVKVPWKGTTIYKTWGNLEDAVVDVEDLALWEPLSSECPVG